MPSSPPKTKSSLAYTNNAQIAKNNMTAGLATKKRTTAGGGAEWILHSVHFFWLLDGGLPLSRTPKATESAIHIDTTCQFSVRQVAGGRRVVSCGFAGVTRPAATKRTNKDSKERYRGTEEEK